MRRALAPSSALLLALACGVPRAAADEKEWIASVQPGFALLKVGDRNAWGGGGGADLAYCVSDALAIRATGAFTGHSLPAAMDMKGKVTAPGGTALAWHAGAGITYSIDVLRLIPYFDLSFGALGTVLPGDKGTAKSAVDFGIEIGLGVDYLVTRRIAVGVVVRYHAYLTALSQIPVYLYAGPRIAFHFGG